MNKATAERLKNNPHYQMSKKQQREVEETEREEMVEFGKVNMHNQSIPKHNVRVERLARVS